MSVVQDAWEGLSDTVKHVFDAVSLGVAVGAVIKMLPAIAALLSIVWSGIRIWESETVRRLTGRDQSIRTLRKLYQNTVDEPVPAKLSDTLKDLK